MTSLYLSKENMEGYHLKIFKWYWERLEMEMKEEQQTLDGNIITMTVPDFQTHAATVKAKCIESILIRVTIYGPNIVETSDLYFQQDKCSYLEVENEIIEVCTLTMQDISSTIDSYVFSWSEKMCHYVFYPFAKWFEPMVSPLEVISDWLITHMDIFRGEGFFRIDFKNLEGKALPTYEELEAIEIPSLAGIMGDITDGQMIGFIGCMASPGILSSLLLTRDKLMEAKSKMKEMQTSITATFTSLQTSITSLSASVNSINSKLAIINNSLHLWS